MTKKNRNRTRFLAFAALIVFSLTGCSSDKKYDDLEKRVSYLESKLGVSSENTATGSTSVPTATTPTSSDIPFYYLDGMSAQDIINMYIDSYQSPPYQGESFDEYYSNFPAKPFITHDTYKHFNGEATVLSQWVDMPGYGRFDYELDRMHTIDNITRTAVLSIEIKGSHIEMDGTIGYGGDYYSISTKLFIKDYETASSVYDGLYKWISENCNYSNIKDSRSAEIWNAIGYYNIPEDANGYTFVGPETILYMSKVLNGPLNSSYSEKVDGYILEINCTGKVRK